MGGHRKGSGEKRSKRSKRSRGEKAPASGSTSNGSVHRHTSNEGDNSLEKLTNVMASFVEKISNNQQDLTAKSESLTSVMASFVEKISNNQQDLMAKGESVPTFDPNDYNQASTSWCNKVDELRKIFGWSEEVTIYLALAKLRGLAETWYKGLSSLTNTWEEWKRKLQAAFPPQRDMYETLGKMMRRRKRREENYAQYFHEMLSLVSACKITGADAVSCIIGGIDDHVIKAGAKAGKHQTPESLYEYLSTHNELERYHKPKYSKQMSKSHFRNNRPDTTKPNNSANTCFKCGKTGHFARDCKSRIEARCGFCGESGHKYSECVKRKKIEVKPVK